MVLMRFNTIHPITTFTTRDETDKEISFPYLAIQREQDKLTLYIKPTSTEIIFCKVHAIQTSIN
jgi:hypothetical protein